MIKRKYFYSYVALSEKGSPIAAGDGVLTTTSWFKKDSFMLTREVKNRAKIENPQAASTTLFAFNRI